MDFKEFSEFLEELSNTSKRLEKTEIVRKILKSTKDYSHVLLLLEGRVFPVWSDQKLGIASKMVIKAISKAFGETSDKIEKDLAKRGDLGLSAEKFASNKKQQTLFGSEELSIKKVFSNMEKLASIEGDKSVDKKVGLIAELLNNASPIEAKYVVRMALGELRVGVGFGTIRDAVSREIFPEIIGLVDKDVTKEKKGKILELKDDKVSDKKLIDYNFIRCETYEDARSVYNQINDGMQSAYDKLNETYKVVEIAREKGLKGLLAVGLEVMTPIRVMLMQKVHDVKEAATKIEFPFALEYKYDGFRCQVHKKGDQVELWTRNMENVTPQFPDIVERVKQNVKGDVILDGEILGLIKGKFVPFQEISQRIKRKYDIEKMVKELPVVYATWDILYFEKSLIDLPQRERREILKKHIKSSDELFVSEQIIIENEEEGDKFYKKSLDMGNEGVVAKDLNAAYKPGNRVGCWLKIKPVMDPLDLVIVGAEWGEGKRASWLTTFVIACRDGDDYLEMGKVGTGIKEKSEEGTSFEELTSLLKPLVTSENGKEVKVKPKIVIEVKYEEIQKSPTYSSGYALRFPRFVQIREDVGLKDVDDLKKVEDYYNEQ